MYQPLRVRQLDRYDDYYDQLLKIASRQRQMTHITREVGCDSTHLFGGFYDGDIGGFLRLTVGNVIHSSPLSFQGLPVKEGRIRGLGVHKAFRRKGLGALMLEHASSVAQSRGARQLRVMTQPDNAIAHQMFLAAGGVAFAADGEIGFIVKIG